MAPHRSVVLEPRPEARRRRRAVAGWALGLLVAFAPAFASAQVTAAIAANRTSGLAPLAVRFDATGSDCNGNGTAGQWNEDLEQCLYSWNFGDSSSPPYAYGAAASAGQPRSANLTDGFIAGHVFENPGTYTVTLTIRNPNGQTATRTQVVTASAYSGSSQCISTSGNFTGCPSGSAQVTQSNFSSALSSCAGSGARRCLFRRGDTFTAGGGVSLPGGPGIVGAYGSGNRPVVQGSQSGDGGFIGGGSDWRIVDLDFNGLGQTGASHRLFYRTRIRNVSGAPGLVWWGAGNANLYLVRSEIENNQSDYGLYINAENFVLLGSKVSGNGSFSSGSHNFRAGDMNRTVWASNTIGPANGGGVARFTGENGGSSRWVVRDNHYTVNVWGGLQFGPQYGGAISGGDDGPVNRGLFEANYAVASGSSYPDELLMNISSIQDVTFRNNILDISRRFGHAIRIQAGQSSDGLSSNITIANNTAIWQAGADDGVAAFSSAVSSARIFNNLLYHTVSFSGSVSSCSGCQLHSNNLKTGTNPFTATSFADPSKFQLKTGSAAAGAGITRNEVLADFAGTLRGTSRDLGAWRLGAAGSPPPPPVLLP